MSSNQKSVNIPRLPINLNVIFDEFANIQANLSSIDFTIAIPAEKFASETDACRTMMTSLKLLSQKIYDLSFSVESLTSENDMLRQRLRTFADDAEGERAGNSGLQARIDHLSMKLGKKNYWKNRSRNFENLYNELAIQVKSQLPQSSRIAQLKDSMAQNKVNTAVNEKEFASYLDKVTCEYVTTIESLHEELNTYKEKLAQFIPKNKISLLVRRDMTPNKRAKLEEINDLITSNDLDEAEKAWRQVRFAEIEGESWEANFQYLKRIILHQKSEKRPELADITNIRNTYESELDKQQYEINKLKTHIELQNQALHDRSMASVSRSRAESPVPEHKLRLLLDDKTAMVSRLEAEVTALKDLLRDASTQYEQKDLTAAYEIEKDKVNQLTIELDKLHTNLPSERECNNFKSVIAAKDKEIELYKCDLADTKASEILIGTIVASQEDVDEMLSRSSELEKSVKEMSDQLEQVLQTLSMERKKHKEERNGMQLEQNTVTEEMQTAFENYRATEARSQQSISALKQNQRALQQKFEASETDFANLVDFLSECYEDWNIAVGESSQQVSPLPKSANTQDRALYAKGLVNIMLSDGKHLKKTFRSMSPQKDTLVNRIENSIADVKQLIRQEPSNPILEQIFDEKLRLDREISKATEAVEAEYAMHMGISDAQDLGHWALERWKVAESKVVELRNALLDKTTNTEESRSLKGLIEKGEKQITNLQNAVTWLQGERKNQKPNREELLEENLNLKTEIETLRKKVNNTGSDLQNITQNLQNLQKLDSENQAQIRALLEDKNELENKLEIQENALIEELKSLQDVIAQRFRLDHHVFIAEKAMNGPHEVIANLTEEMKSLNKKTQANALKADDLNKELSLQKRIWSNKEEEYKIEMVKLEKTHELTAESNIRLKGEIEKLNKQVVELDMQKSEVGVKFADEQLKTQGVFEQGKILGIGEGRSIERQEMESEFARLENLVSEYRRSSEYRGNPEEVERMVHEISQLKQENFLLSEDIKEKSGYINSVLANYQDNKEHYSSRATEYQRLLTLKDEELCRLRYFTEQLQSELDNRSYRSKT